MTARTDWEAFTDWRLASTNHTYDGNRWIRWWAPDDRGYTDNLDEAGVYELDRLLARPHIYQSLNCLAVPDYIVRRLQARAAPGVTNCPRVWALLQQVALWPQPATRLPAAWRSKAVRCG